MYLSTLTDDELLRYAGTLQLTPLETELARRLSDMEIESHGNAAYAETQEAEAEELKEKVEGLEEKIEGLEEKIEDLEAELRESLA